VKNKFVTDEEDGVRLFASVEAANKAILDQTVNMAVRKGFSTVQAEGTGFLCGRPGTGQLVEVYPDGTWEYRDASEDEIKTESGRNAQTLGWFLGDLPMEEQ